MATNPDDIKLSAEQRKLIAQHADQLGKSWAEIVRAMIRFRPPSVDPSRNHNETAPATIRRQRQSLEKLFEELDQLPVQNPDDGFSGRDHDQVLYGDKK